nr:lipid-A-disaccharide synthase [Gemmatimonadota bacterium]
GAAGLLEHASVVLAKSGTTTLEAALAGTPLVVAYRTSALTYALARRLVKVPHVALANLVAGARVAPELLQDQATPQALAAALVPLFNAASPERAAMDAGLSRVRTALGSPGAAARVARIASQLLADR